MKTIGGLRKTCYRDHERVQLHAYLVAAAYNLPRIIRLVPNRYEDTDLIPLLFHSALRISDKLRLIQL
jgi:hypothetical protein